MKKMLLGFSEEQAIELDLKTIQARIVYFGAFGSEKTIAFKVISEGLVLQRIPLIIFDTRYDIASYLIGSLITKQDLSKFETHIKSMPPVIAGELMQIVSAYAGSGAYDFLYKEDKLLNQNNLYESTNNSELRTAYFQILIACGFRKANDPRSYLYCAIATYNTDAGNLSRAFIGTTKRYQTFPEIYEVIADLAYQYFKIHLPDEETQRCNERVSSSIKVFAA